jgi:hypothetical protein
MAEDPACVYCGPTGSISDASSPAVGVHCGRTQATPSPGQGVDDVDSQPSDTATRLYAIADAAAGFVEQIDALRGKYPARGPLGPDPVAAVLEEAAAAASDLRSSATSAADTISRRSPEDAFHQRS